MHRDRPLNRPEDYLACIWELTFPTGVDLRSVRARPTAASRIAESLGLSRPTVGEMLGKLESRGLITRGPRKEAILTQAGRTEAMQAVRRHRLVERFLADSLGYEPWELAAHATTVAEGFDDETIERLFDHLGAPERCPHGYPIDPDHELRENPTLRPLSVLPAGRPAALVRVAEREPEVQRLLGEAQLPWGVDVQVGDVDLDAVTIMRVDGAGAPVRLLTEQAARVFVRPAGVPVVPAKATCWADILKRERELAGG